MLDSTKTLSSCIPGISVVNAAGFLLVHGCDIAYVAVWQLYQISRASSAVQHNEQQTLGPNDLIKGIAYCSNCTLEYNVCESAPENSQGPLAV